MLLLVLNRFSPRRPLRSAPQEGKNASGRGTALRFYAALAKFTAEQLSVQSLGSEHLKWQVKKEQKRSYPVPTI